MTGPQHYARGEQLLGWSEDIGLDYGQSQRELWVIQAQAHFAAARVALEVEARHVSRLSWREGVGLD
jgi:hypothetical protein